MSKRGAINGYDSIIEEAIRQINSYFSKTY